MILILLLPQRPSYAPPRNSVGVLGRAEAPGARQLRRNEHVSLLATEFLDEAFMPDWES